VLLQGQIPHGVPLPDTLASELCVGLQRRSLLGYGV